MIQNIQFDQITVILSVFFFYNRPGSHHVWNELNTNIFEQSVVTRTNPRPEIYWTLKFQPEFQPRVFMRYWLTESDVFCLGLARNWIL